MPELLTLQDLANGHLDVKALGEAANGDENTIVTTRTGNTYPSAERAINIMFKNGGLPATPFETRALMTASALVDGDYAMVTDDTDNNGLYVKTAGAWTKSAYDPLTQAKKYTDASINNIFSNDINIADLSKSTAGYYVIYSNGVIEINAAFSVLGAYEIIPSTLYQVPADYSQQFAFYDENMVYISGLVSADSNHQFTTPSNAKYIKLSVLNSQLARFMLCKASEYPSTYTPFAVKKKALKVDLDQVVGLQKELDSMLDPLDIYYFNIAAKANIRNGYYVEFGSGVQYPNAGFNVVGPCDVLPSTTYQTNPTFNNQFAIFDADGNYIEGKVTPAADKTFTTPANAKAVLFTVPDSGLSTFTVAERDDFSNPAFKTFGDFVGSRKLLIKPEQVLGFEDEVREVSHIYDLNIINLETITDNAYISYLTGSREENSAFVATDYLQVKGNTLYRADNAYNQQFAFYDENKVYISGLVSPLPTHTFTTPINAVYARFTIPKTMLNTVVIAEASVFPKSYQPFKVKTFKDIALSNENRVTEIWVSADSTDTDTKVKFRGKNAIQLALNSITDATMGNRYIIRVKKGLYKITKATDFIGYPGYPAMILTKNHVDIVGQGIDNTIVWAELPYNDEDVGPSANGQTYSRFQYQTVYDYADDSELKDICFVGKNLRYTVHIDNPNGENASRSYDTVGFLFKGDKGGLTSMGCGTSSGEKTTIVGGYSLSDRNVPFASHSNMVFNKPSEWSFTNHNFIALANVSMIYLQNSGSLLEDKFKMVGCSFGGMAYVFGYKENWLSGNTSLNRDSFNQAEWRLSGYGNDPFLFRNEVGGKSLLFKSTATGLNNTIRFDVTSSAYPLLIKNNQTNSDVSLYVDSRDLIDGYIVEDGSIDLPAKAWGCKDLHEGFYLYDNNINYTSLAVRLGDCSTTNKLLKVLLNDVVNTITFNKDYTGMTNADIIAEMNTQLVGMTVSSISYGRDYYPNLTDVSETVYNNTATYIPKGSLVTKTRNSIKIANGLDKVYGVALDDIPVMTVTNEGVKKGQGRIMKRGYISALRTEAFFVLADNQTPYVGQRFNVVNGQLVADVNGRISADIDVGVISINC